MKTGSKNITTWKEFSRNSLTHSSAHYLMAIQQLHSTQGYARLSDVARRLKISKGSLSTSIKPLIKKKLILEDENKHLFLSEKGREFALNIKNTYAVFKHFLTDILLVDEKLAEIDACKVEHLLSIESTDKMIRLLKALQKNDKLLMKLQKSMAKHNCSISGCKHSEKCSREKFCFGEVD